MKTKSKYRILSIDFDVFQTVTKEAIEYYPDGADLSTDMTLHVWADKYVYPESESQISSIGCNQKMISDVIKIIKKGCKKNTICEIANSHRHIYDFLFSSYDKEVYDGIQLYHLDMHPDYSNGIAEINCGNWVSYVEAKEPNLDVIWIANPISNDVFNFNKKNERVFENVYTSLKPLNGKKFDMIFLCRSDNWTPPHLDKYFDSLKNQLIDIVGAARIEEGVSSPRDIEPYVNKLKEAIQIFSESRKADKNQ